jgi:membrane-associated phospholipid phosphatase
LKLLRGAYPILLSGYFYSETFFYNKLLLNDIDPLLIKADELIFGFQPSVEFSSVFSSLLWSEIMYFSYFSFYLIIIAFVLYIFFEKRDFFIEAVFKLSFSLYFFYLFYIFVPSSGPQFYFNSPENRLPDAYFFNHIMHFIQKVAEQPTGAFPSSHVGVSVIILWFSYKKVPLLFKLFWPIVLLLILSTVYIKAHYVVDVIGGLFIAPFILYLSNILYRFPAQTHSSTGK